MGVYTCVGVYMYMGICVYMYRRKCLHECTCICVCNDDRLAIPGSRECAGGIYVSLGTYTCVYVYMRKYVYVYLCMLLCLIVPHVVLQGSKASPSSSVL